MSSMGRRWWTVPHYEVDGWQAEGQRSLSDGRVGEEQLHYREGRDMLVQSRGL